MYRSRNCIWSVATRAPPQLAPLHSLGGEAWDRAKRRAAEKVLEVAAELLAIYAQREARPGTALTIDRLMYDQFASAFPFEDSPDQLQAIEAVITDLARARPMDRVVCGDVGFGKTEVALRAAFVTAISGKQVGMLAPTTLLAQQHYQNFRDRLADWPIRVEVLSRFKSKKESSERWASSPMARSTLSSARTSCCSPMCASRISACSSSMRSSASVCARRNS